MSIPCLTIQLSQILQTARCELSCQKFCGPHSFLQFRVPGFLLESHIPNQAVYAPFGALTPPTDNCDECVQICDVVDVVTGTHERGHGYVTEVQRLTGILKFRSSDPATHGHSIEVPISVVLFKPDDCAFKFTPDQGYNVRQGDVVITVRGDHIGKSGTVSRVRLEEKLLDIAWDMDPQVSYIDLS
jgi:hypothetical protein